MFVHALHTVSTIEIGQASNRRHGKMHNPKLRTSTSRIPSYWVAASLSINLTFLRSNAGFSFCATARASFSGSHVRKGKLCSQRFAFVYVQWLALSLYVLSEVLST